MEIYRVNLLIQFKYGKIQTRKDSVLKTFWNTGSRLVKEPELRCFEDKLSWIISKNRQKNIWRAQSYYKVNLLAVDLADWLFPTMMLPLKYFRTATSRKLLVVSSPSDGFWKPQARPKNLLLLTLFLTLPIICRNKDVLWPVFPVY